ncbi:MAG: response regulator [Deltaproteobacteria bacterium]|nr:response regulator [Deltaproteobacteria bacterium]
MQVERRLLRDEIIKRGEVLTTIAAKNAELPLLSDNAELVENAAFSISEIKNVPFVTFYDSQFEPIVHQGMKAIIPPPPHLKSATDFFVREQPGYFEFFAPVFSIRAGGDIDMFEESSPDRLQKEHIGWVRVGLSKEVMNKTVRKMTVNGVLFSLGLVIIGVFLVTLFLNFMLKPLNDLFKAAQNLRDGEYPHVPIIDRNDEISQLSAEFNKMSSAIRDRELQLYYSQKRISDLFERVEHAIFWLDTDFKVIEGNRKFGELCGRVSDFFNLIEADKREAYIKEAKAGELIAKEVMITMAEGQQHTISLSIYPEVEENGKLTGFDGHFIDITENKKMEETMRQTQKLESLGLLAGGIAHDFNNILTVIIGYSDLVAQKTSADNPLYAQINEIREQAIKAAELTRQLLAFSRKQVMELQVINLNDLINNMAKMLGRLIGETIEMRLLPRPSAGNIKADPGQIEQIIMNLAVNAKDAMPEGGSLVFETDSVTLDKEYCKTHEDLTPGKYVLLVVTDTGHGMTPEVRERIFDPFFTTKAKGAGTGLGLSTVYGIIKQLKGHIFVYSEINHGTTFKIYFPEVREAEKEDAPERLSQDALKGSETILVVDDEASIRNLIRDTLQPLGYKVLEAASDETAQEWGKKPNVRIDLLLTDVIMPGMGGKKLADSLQTLMPDMKVLFMSGYTDEVIAHQGVLAPGTLFINKPLLPSVLTKKIREILNR